VEFSVAREDRRAFTFDCGKRIEISFRPPFAGFFGTWHPTAVEYSSELFLEGSIILPVVRRA